MLGGWVLVLASLRFFPQLVKVQRHESLHALHYSCFREFRSSGPDSRETCRSVRKGPFVPYCLPSCPLVGLDFAVAVSSSLSLLL